MSISFSQHEPTKRSVSAEIKRSKPEISQRSYDDEDEDDTEEVSFWSDQNAGPVDLNSIPPLNLKWEHSDAGKGTDSDAQGEAPGAGIEAASRREGDDDEEHFLSDWSRSPSPSAHPPIPTSKKDKLDWDPAQEMDVEAEEGEFAEFLSQVKGKDLDIVREEIDAEIRQLNKEKRNAQRDSEGMDQQVVAQIMVRDHCAHQALSLKISSCFCGCLGYHTSRHRWKLRLNVLLWSNSGFAKA
jgi:hypothetical protein